MSNEPKKPEASNAQPESVSSNRRSFMKTVVTGTVAAGLAASVGKAEAATAADACSTPEYPTTGPTSVKVLINKNNPVTLDRLWEIIHGTFQPSGCPACGLGGVPHNPNYPYPISQISIESAYLSKEVDSMVIVQDASDSGPCK